MSVYDNKFVGKLHERDIYYIEKMANSRRSFEYISEKTAFYSPNKDKLDIVPGSKSDGILLIEATMECTKRYNLMSNYFFF